MAFIAVEAKIEDPSIDRDKVYHYVQQLEYQANGMPREDISFFLDLPPAQAINLLNTRKALKNEADEYSDQLAVQQRLYDEYDFMCTKFSRRIIRVPCFDQGKIKPIKQISREIWQALNLIFPDLRQSNDP